MTTSAGAPDDDSAERRATRVATEGTARAVAAVSELFPAVYRRLHSRFDVDRVGVRAAALLDHLSTAGPLTVGEIADHISCAQSVASEVVDGLEARGLLDRMQDARDRRRTLVWLTPKGLDWCERSKEVLSTDRLARAIEAMPTRDRVALVEGMRALLRAADDAFAPGSAAARRGADPEDRSTRSTSAAGGAGGPLESSDERRRCRPRRPIEERANEGRGKAKDRHPRERERKKTMSGKSCESCGMPIDLGTYCPHCLGADGQLQPFEERFERMVQWQLRKNPGTSRAQAEAETRAHMAKMPAWKDHPRLGRVRA